MAPPPPDCWWRLDQSTLRWLFEPHKRPSSTHTETTDAQNYLHHDLKKIFLDFMGLPQSEMGFFFLPYSNICINLFPNGKNIYRAISPCLRFFGKCRKMTKVSDSTNDKIWDNMSIRSSSTWRKLLSPHLKVFSPINVRLHHETWLTKEPHIFSSFIPRWVSQVDRGENRGESEGT